MKSSLRARLPQLSLLALFLLAVPLAACGGSGKGSNATPTSTPTATHSPTSTPTATHSPTATPTPLPATATNTASVSPTPQLRIVRPAPGPVAMIIAVEFESLVAAQVIVRPIPDDPNQAWWVQETPKRDPEAGSNRWKSYPVYIGQESDPSGLPFKICVVNTNEQLIRGQNLRYLPDGPSDCIDVTRQ